MPSKRHAIAEHIRQRDISQTRHDFAFHNVEDGQEHLGSNSERVFMDDIPSRSWTPTDYAIFLLSALAVIGMGVGIWFLLVWGLG